MPKRNTVKEAVEGLIAGEQPEVPELVSPDVKLGAAAEDEILAGTDDDAKIGLDEPAPEPKEDVSAMTARAMLQVAESVKILVENQQAVRQVPYSEIKPVTPWNPEGKRVRLRPRGEIYQNGYPVNPMMISEEEIELCNGLKPGRYFDRQLEVQRFRDGGVNIVYSNAKVDQRIEFYAKYPSFKTLALAIMEERKVKEERRRRGEFDSEEAL